MLPEPTPLNRLKSFSARYTLDGPFTADAVFLDPECVDDPLCSDICTPIQIGVDIENAQIVNCGDEVPETVLECFDNPPLWVNGLLRSYGRDNKNGLTRVSIDSYFEYLRNKPINTQQFDGTDLNAVFPIVSTYFNGTPPSLIDYSSFRNVKIKGPVEGNDSYAELQKLAQAGQAHLFVQVGGVLTVERWKDDRDPTEITIPEALVVSAEPTDYKNANTTMIRARGSSVSSLTCGEKTLTQADKETRQPGPLKKCIVSGIPTPSVSTTYNNLTGSKEDIQNAELLSPNAKTTGGKFKIGEGNYKQIVKNQDDSYFGPTAVVRDFLVKAKKQEKKAEAIWGSYSDRFGGYGYAASDKNFFNRFQQIMQRSFPVPYSSFGLGAFGSPNFSNPKSENTNQYSDQPSLKQVEVVALDPNLSACGIQQEDLENKYVPCKEILFDIAVRRFQEIKLAAKTWNVEVPYIPCLRLNQMIEFTVPRTSEDCPVQVVKGVIGGLDIDHQVTKKGEVTKIRLTVMDVSCLGQTSYTSGNLIQTLCGSDGSSSINPWIASALGIDSVAQVDECGHMFVIGAGSAFIEYTHGEMTVGAQYEVSFEYITDQGFGNISFTGAGIPGIVSGTGTYNQIFYAGLTTEVFKWELLYPPVATYVRICNQTITKTVIR